MTDSAGLQPPLILASASPRRRELLAGAGLQFEVIVPNVVEQPAPGESPAEYVLRNAREKAEAVDAPADAVVIAADTIVTYEGAILEKPADPEAAVAMISRLSGTVHQVMTGVAIRDGGGWRFLDVVSTDVVFRDLLAAEVQRYVDTGEPMDKAGSYGIQGGAAGFVRAIRGSYTNVVGLPLAEVLEALPQ